MARNSDGDEQEQGRLKTPAFVAWLIFAGILITVGAVYIGKSDTGAIDVSSTIRNSNQALEESGGDQSGHVDVVSQTFQNMPNGGLVPQSETGSSENSTQPEPQTSDTATTTDSAQTASSTEAAPAPESEATGSIESTPINDTVSTE